MRIPVLYLCAAVACASGLISSAAAKPLSFTERGEYKVSVALAPSPDAPQSATGSAEVKTKQKNSSKQKSVLELSLNGLRSGIYRVDALLADKTADPVELATVELSASTPNIPDAAANIQKVLPSDLDVRQIVGLSVEIVGEKGRGVILSGQAETDTLKYRFLAKGQLTGPKISFTDAEGKLRSLKPRARLLVQSRQENNAEVKRHFILVGLSLPPETLLNVNVNGQKVAEGTTTRNGKLHLTADSLPADLNLETIRSMSITDGNGTLIIGVVAPDM